MKSGCWRSTVKATHWLDMLMKLLWEMTSWQIPRNDRSKNGPSPWIVNLVPHEFFFNISYILYYREINTWWFLSEFLTTVCVNEMFALCLHRGERSWSADRVSKLCFANTENTCSRMNKMLINFVKKYNC